MTAFDQAQIYVKAGKGGDGAVHFRREKYVPRGGPDGGDGGRGGGVILRANPTLSSLTTFRRKRRFAAPDGRPGGKSNKTGRDGQQVIVEVPLGTLLRDRATGQLIGDLTETGQQLTVAAGGRGGRGNARFATARNQAPRMAERGEPGEERWLDLELRLIADVGIIGAPNAGKSTFLAAVTNARPKIAEYPFTTLQPNLGVVDQPDGPPIILADIPGLIEGAHQGVGLGYDFLRHIQRTRVLIHLLDGSSADPLADFAQVNSELALYDPDLAQKPQIVALNKIDLPDVRERIPDLHAAFASRGVSLRQVSALARQGLSPILTAARQALADLEPVERVQDMPVYAPPPDPGDFHIDRQPDASWRVTGAAIERAAAMTYWEHDEAVRRFQRLMERLGVDHALREAGAQIGDTVHIGEYELEWQE
jgi:GTPase